MVPDKFNMVDMGGIDLIMMQGEEVPGLYDRLVESITLCRYQCLYNWIFDGIQIPPIYVQMSIDSETGNVRINEGVEVDDEDVIHIYSLANPYLISLTVSENGVFEPPEDVDGFNIVTVNVPSIQPILESLTATDNGVYIPEEGVDGFNQVTVSVEGILLRGTTPPTSDIGSVGDYYMEEIYSELTVFGIELITVARGTNYNFTYWGAKDIQLVFEDSGGNTISLSEIQNKHCYYAIGTNQFNQQDAVINGYISTYYEHGGLPGYWKIEAEIPTGYKLKGLRVVPRSDTSYRDFWRTFTLTQWDSDRNPVKLFLSEADLVEADWDFSGYNDFYFTPSDILRIPAVNLYYKTAEGWILIK